VVPIAPRGNPLLSGAVIVLLVLLALFLGQASRTVANPEGLQLVAGLAVGVAIAVLVLRVLRRR
jgi:hypothetical protein